MSILDLHADELLGAARNTPYIPQPKPEPKTSFWGALTAAPRGVSAGAAESSGFLADVLGAFGQAYATTYTGDLAGGMSDVQRQQTAEARAQMQKGLEWSSEAGDLFRGVADSYRPDPRTASTAERLVFDFSRFATKAIGYAVAAGPVAGAGLVAADEGLTAADALKRQGVDLGTRTAVGAVQGIGAGLGVLLPASGATLAGTAGLVAAGGPGSFIAQQAITREILKAADFGHLADQYDPFDPVGLAVATLVPAGFGAYGLRRSRMAAEAAKVTPEQVDAALVAHQTEVRDASTLAAPDDLAGQARHADALARAEDQMAAGEPVRVADVVLPDVERAANFRAWFGDSAVRDADGAPLVVYHGTGRDFEAFSNDALGSNTGVSDAREGFFFSSSGKDASEYAWKDGEPGQVMPVYLSIQNPYVTDMVVTAANNREFAKVIRAAKASGHDGVAAFLDTFGRESSVFVAFRPEQVKSAIGNSGRFDPTSGSLTDPLSDFAGRVQSATRAADAEARSMGLTPEKVTRAEVTPPPLDAEAKPAGTPPRPAAEAAPDPKAKAAMIEAGQVVPPDAAEVAAMTARLTELQATNPDLQVMLDGMDKPARLSDFLAAVQREADAMKADAPDFMTAAECFLSFGA